MSVEFFQTRAGRTSSTTSTMPALVGRACPAECSLLAKLVERTQSVPLRPPSNRETERAVIRRADITTETRPVRCAIYTRKSTDEGLDQAFNSLDAQREAGEAFVLSRKHEGWVCLPDRYDDGGYSGGNIERPALKRLMADIEAGLHRRRGLLQGRPPLPLPAGLLPADRGVRPADRSCSSPSPSRSTRPTPAGA